MISTEVRVHSRVVDFCRTLPPEPRKKIRSGIRGLKKSRGDIKPLEGSLSGFCRLRVGAYRIIYSVRMECGVRIVDCHYVGHRSIVYQVLEAKEHLKYFLEQEE